MLLKDFLSFFGLTYYPNNGYVTIGSPYNNDFAAADIMIYTSSEDVARYAKMHLLDFIEDEIEFRIQNKLGVWGLFDREEIGVLDEDNSFSIIIEDYDDKANENGMVFELDLLRAVLECIDNPNCLKFPVV